jgi:hypothetical protein
VGNPVQKFCTAFYSNRKRVREMSVTKNRETSVTKNRETSVTKNRETSVTKIGKLPLQK